MFGGHLLESLSIEKLKFTRCRNNFDLKIYLQKITCKSLVYNNFRLPEDSSHTTQKRQNIKKILLFEINFGI